MATLCIYFDDILSRRSLFKRVKNKKTLTETKWKSKLPVKTTYTLRTNRHKKERCGTYSKPTGERRQPDYFSVGDHHSNEGHVLFNKKRKTKIIKKKQR